MSVPVAFATIIIVWSTTPLGITWSNATLNPVAAVCIRMCIAALLGLIVLKALNIQLLWTRKAVTTYASSLLGIFGALTCTYYAAEFVPSGMISIMYALSPVISSLFSVLILGQNNFTRAKVAGFILSFFGMLIICIDDWVIYESGWIGLFLLLLAVILYSLSGVLVQKEKLKAHPLSLTVGTLVLSTPLFLMAWLLLDGVLPVLDWSSSSPWAVIYLAVFGSLVGFACYFYIVQSMGASAVAMVTLMTPVLALILGNIFNAEPISVQMMAGTFFVLVGLAIYYQFMPSLWVGKIRSPRY